ncbi:MAG TPA: hypothetical protein VGE07_19045 [Herpetosiphonaceae bacterium]
MADDTANNAQTEPPPGLAGHLWPDLDCLAGLWMLRRWGGHAAAPLRFVPAGTRVPGEQPWVHVDTGGGPFDHHDSADRSLSSAELVRRAIRPDDWALEQLAAAVTADDQAQAGDSGPLRARELIAGLNLRFPGEPEQVLLAIEPCFEAWYAAAGQREEQRRAFADRIEFDTPWGLGVAVESAAGVSSRDAYGMGAVLFAYRDAHGMGVAAQARSAVDLSAAYATLRRIDPGADWYLHPGRRLLLCGSAKAPPRAPSALSLDELIDVLSAEA